MSKLSDPAKRLMRRLRHHIADIVLDSDDNTRQFYEIRLFTNMISIPNHAGIDELTIAIHGDSVVSWIADRNATAWDGASQVFNVKRTDDQWKTFSLVQHDTELLDGMYWPIFKAIDADLNKTLSLAITVEQLHVAQKQSSRLSRWGLLTKN